MSRRRAGGARAASPARRAAVAALLLAGAGVEDATAQGGGPWSGTGQVSLQHSTGTSSYTALALAHDLTFERGVHAELHLAWGYARSSYPAQEFSGGTTRTVTRRDDRHRALADLSLRVPAEARVYGVTRLVAEHDENQNIDRRLHGALGAGTHLLRRPRHSLQLEASAGRIDEDDTRGRGLAYSAAGAMLQHSFSWKAGGSVSSTLEWVHALGDAAGGLGRARVSLYAPFTRRVGLNVSYAFVHDTEPSFGLYNPESDDEVLTQATRTTTSLSAGLRVGW